MPHLGRGKRHRSGQRQPRGRVLPHRLVARRRPSAEVVAARLSRGRDPRLSGGTELPGSRRGAGVPDGYGDVAAVERAPPSPARVELRPDNGVAAADRILGARAASEPTTALSMTTLAVRPLTGPDAGEEGRHTVMPGRTDETGTTRGSATGAGHC